MALLQLVGQRWTLRILWELRHGAMTFRRLQDACDAISPTVLNSRLRDLKAAGLVSLSADGYVLTALGKELGVRLLELTAWAERWADARAAVANVSGAKGAPVHGRGGRGNKSD